MLIFPLRKLSIHNLIFRDQSSASLDGPFIQIFRKKNGKKINKIPANNVCFLSRRVEFVPNHLMQGANVMDPRI